MIGSFNKYYILLLILLSFSYACKATGGTATACGHHDYPPWHWEQDGKIVGICPEITETLFAQLGVDIDFSYIGPWKRCQKHIEAGVVDIAPCSFKNVARETYSQFSETPMYEGEHAIFTKKGKEFSFSSWEDLIGKTAVVMLGSSMGKEFDAFLAEHVNLIQVNNYKQMFLLLELERADFVPHGRRSGAAILKVLGKENMIKALPTPVTQTHIYLALSSQSKYVGLLPRLDDLMRESDYQAWVDQLIDKYTQMYIKDYVRLAE